MLATAVLAAAFLATLCVRVASGRDLALSARGVRAGWHQGPRAGAIASGLAAPIVTNVRRIALACLVAFLVLLPAGRERTLVDDAGLHLRAGLSVFDRNLAWSSVTAADVSQDARGYTARLRVDDGTVIDTRGKVFIGLSEYELYRFAGLHRAR